MVRKIRSSVGAGTASLLIQHSALDIKNIYVEHPQLLLIEQGQLTVEHQQHITVVSPGEMLALSHEQYIDSQYVLSDEGIFKCAIISWDTNLLPAARELSTPLESALASVISCKTIPHVPTAFQQSFSEFHQAILWNNSYPPTIIRQRMIEFLLWLAHLGVRFSSYHNENLTAQVRSLLVNNLNQTFSAAQVAEKLMMNEVMLRRRLAAENSILRDLMQDVRMTQALNLLQCTDLSTSLIAQQVGYESASRFAERFRKRFGFAPTAIRGHLRHP
jgi:AraC-like DNA-binding protein